jgi:hypothetical protein
MLRAVSAFVAMVVALLLAAPAVAATPTKAQFIRKGDAACAQTLRELRPIRARAEAAKALPEAEKWRATVDVWTAHVRVQAKFVSAIHAIGVPNGDRVARALVAGMDEGLVLARRIRNGFAQRDADTLAQVIPRYVRLNTDLNRSVSRYGFRVCGRTT